MSYEDELRRQREREATEAVSGLPLFTEVRTMARRTDPESSKNAAIGISDHLPRIQQLVYEAFLNHGPMTAKTAEQLPEFERYGYSTIRKRCGELHARGLLRYSGEMEAGCNVYEVASQESAA